MAEKAAFKRVNPRPQRLHSWFTLIPVEQLLEARPAEVLFLDSFVTVDIDEHGAEPAFRVRFEGREEMAHAVEAGLIFVWYGENLQVPDRPFPTLWEQKYPSTYVSSAPTIFEDTHVMDFVENGSDNLHFGAVHLWDYSRIYDHEVTPERITLKQETLFHYGRCSSKRSIRLLSHVLPELELTQDYAYHGPGLAVVGATGSGSPRMHALVSLTPEGEHRTRVYVTMAIHPDTFPRWAERLYGAVRGGRALCDLLAGVMANYVRNEFDIDAVIWRNKKYLGDSSLLPSEKHLREVIRWGTTFYPNGFEAPEVPRLDAGRPRWRHLDEAANIKPGEVQRYSVADEELIARRTKEGEVRVFDAYCPHQGAHLGHGGRVDDDCIRCPFHAFYFDSEGRCLGPNRKNKDTFIERLRLTPIRYRVAGGDVEVWL